MRKRSGRELYVLGRLAGISVAVGLLSLWSVWSGGSASAATLVKIDGSSTVYPITEAVAEEFQKVNRKVRITVGISGTGGGFKKFCSGEIDIADASRPIKASEIELCKSNKVEYIELPVAFDGLAVMVNPKNNWANSMTVKELKRLWEPAAQGKITRWNQIRVGWPDKEIHLFGPGVDSGTYDYFTEAIVGQEHASRGDFTASEDDNVLVQGVVNDPLALGFFGIAYYEHNKDRLKLVPIDDENPNNGSGPIHPEVATIMNGTYQPLSRPILIYVSKKALDRPEVDQLTKFYLSAGRSLVKEVGYVPLPDDVHELAAKRLEKRIVGSVFGGEGSQVGVALKSLLSAGGR